MNRALNQIPKRAEKREGPQLHETFVDSGIADVLDTVDHQVLYGRRGTGKTHALAYLASERASRGDVAEDEELIEDRRFIEKVDELLVALTNVRVDGDVEVSVESERKDIERSGASIGAAISEKPGLQLTATAESAAEGRALLRETRRGSERIALNFSDVARALRELASTLSSRRIWSC